ncbi:MAG TPA: TPM domain-containing protein [Gemmatimonadales bacterium]|nr:TPM domain-containing protein [Gemmatimonadales bacterium]
MATVVPAQSAGVDSLFPRQPDGYVTDRAGVVDEASKDRMTSLIERLRATTGAEIAVVTLPTIGQEDEAEVALAIGRAWGVGSKADVGSARRNAGIVLLLVPLQNHAPGTGHIRIEVGQGLEGLVTDAGAGRIRDLIRPDLVQEDYGKALTAAVETLASTIARGMGVDDSTLTNARPIATGAGRAPPFAGLLPFLLLFLFFLFMTRGFGGRRRRRHVYWGGPWIGGGGFGGGFGGGGWGGGGGGFGGFGGGGGFSGGGAGGRF